jgi:hypothetical protein
MLLEIIKGFHDILFYAPLFFHTTTYVLRQIEIGFVFFYLKIGTWMLQLPASFLSNKHRMTQYLYEIDKDYFVNFIGKWILIDSSAFQVKFSMYSLVNVPSGFIITVTGFHYTFWNNGTVINVLFKISLSEWILRWSTRSTKRRHTLTDDEEIKLIWKKNTKTLQICKKSSKLRSISDHSSKTLTYSKSATRALFIFLIFISFSLIIKRHRKTHYIWL